MVNVAGFEPDEVVLIAMFIVQAPVPLGVADTAALQLFVTV